MNANKYEKTALTSGADPLSDLMQMLMLDVDVYHNAKVCGDWLINERTLAATCFHIAISGQCLLDVPDHFQGLLHCGDLVIFPRELAHTMTPTEKGEGPQQHLPYQQAKQLPGTGMLCAEVRFKHSGSRYLLDALPPVLVIPRQHITHWLEPLLTLILQESLNNSAASASILAKLSELLFTYALRQYLNDHPNQAGMLALYGHSKLAQSIQQIHQQPEKNWTLAAMAKEATLSRTTFSETFKAVSGWSPFEYLTWWRMQLAWEALSRGDSVAQVAEDVGYQSEAAFARAFKKEFNTTPGKVRRKT